LPGVPQIYYVGLLAGSNDEELLLKTGNGRDVNRHYYTIDEIKKSLERGVVRDLFELCRLRNSHPAFTGRYQLLDSSDDSIVIKWSKARHWIKLKIDLNTKDYQINKS
jgi:sucrose phosphorylase